MASNRIYCIVPLFMVSLLKKVKRGYTMNNNFIHDVILKMKKEILVPMQETLQ